MALCQGKDFFRTIAGNKILGSSQETRIHAIGLQKLSTCQEDEDAIFYGKGDSRNLLEVFSSRICQKGNVYRNNEKGLYVKKTSEFFSE